MSYFIFLFCFLISITALCFLLCLFTGTKAVSKHTSFKVLREVQQAMEARIHNPSK